MTNQAKRIKKNPTQVENQIKKSKAKQQMEYKEKAETSNAISRQSKGFKERMGEKNRLTKAKTSQ